MKKLLAQVFLFLSPIVIFLGILNYVLWDSKENFYGLNMMITGSEKYLIGYKYHEHNYRFLKWGYITSNPKKNIWTLGTSRVLPFRREMFNKSFYNAGYTVLSLLDYQQFIKSIPENKYPKYLIIGLDQWMFNSAHDELLSKPPINLWKNSFSKNADFSTLKSVYEDIIDGEIKIGAFKSSQHKIGLNAVLNDTGFRNDGSMHYGKQIKKLISGDTTARDHNFAISLDRISQGNRLFEPGDQVNPESLIVTDKLLNFCKNHKITVIGFLPPFADKVYKKIISSGKLNYIKKINEELKPIFKKYDYEIYDYSSVSLCNSNDNEVIDGLHGGEITYQRMLLSILKSGSVLNNVTDSSELKYDLSAKTNSYTLYAY